MSGRGVRLMSESKTEVGGAAMANAGVTSTGTNAGISTGESPTVGVRNTTGAATGAVLGVSVVDDSVTSVVKGAQGEILASNIVDLTDASAQSAEQAITELVESVPFAVDTIAITCARPETAEYLAAVMNTDPNRPAWAETVSVADLPVALAEVARIEPSRGGIVSVVDLDRAGVPSPGRSIITVDTATGTIVGASEFKDGTPAPVTEPDGAIAIADAVTTMPGGTNVTQVICTGIGAELPGVAPALEYAVAKPVSLATQPSLAAASGAASSVRRSLQAPAAGPTKSAGAAGLGKQRYWLIGAAIAGALLLGGIAIAALTGGGGDAAVPASTVTVTETPEASTVTETGTPRTNTVVEERVETVTQPRATQTQTQTQTVTPPPVTVTDTTTVVVTVPAASAEPEPGSGGTGDTGEQGTP